MSDLTISEWRDELDYKRRRFAITRELSCFLARRAGEDKDDMTPPPFTGWQSFSVHVNSALH
jgi:hypothetical protein